MSSSIIDCRATGGLDEQVGKHWRRSLERCGIKHRRLYAQRHTFLSHALAMGNSPADLAQVAGHSTEMLLKTYAKPTGRIQLPEWNQESIETSMKP